MRRRCLCRCHEGSVTDRKRADGVDVANTIEAAVACKCCLDARCLDAHCPALRNTALPGEELAVQPAGFTVVVNGERHDYVYDGGEFRPPAPWTGEDGG